MFSVETSRLPAGHWLANRRLTAAEVNLASDLMNRDLLGKKQRSGPGKVRRLSIRLFLILYVLVLPVATLGAQRKPGPPSYYWIISERTLPSRVVSTCN